MRDGRPTVRQVYALAGALCERAGEGFPETRAEASELIERLRIENGHPAPRLSDTPLRRDGGGAAAGADASERTTEGERVSREARERDALSRPTT